MSGKNPGASQMEVTVAIDCMGGDHGVKVTVVAALAWLQRDHHSRVILVGLEDAIRSELHHSGPIYAHDCADRIQVMHASEVVEMDEPPVSALRLKKDSSMRVAINLVKTGVAQVCISAGNTGALMAIARFVLKTLPGIDRPAIASILPTVDGHTRVLDLGANVDCSAEHLLQFALMGAEWCSSVEQIERPRVGLLNIGEEDIKGNEAVKAAALLLRGSGLNFIGNVEGNDIFKGRADVVVCDGFVGNVALKSSEGIALLLGQYLREEFNRNAWTRLAALVARPVLKAFKARIDHRRYNGACLLGLRGVVIKSHGSADDYAFVCAIDNGVQAVRTELLRHISDRMAALTDKAAINE